MSVCTESSKRFISETNCSIQLSDTEESKDCLTEVHVEDCQKGDAEINDFQLLGMIDKSQYRQMQERLRQVSKQYWSLKTLFVGLACLNVIVIILCTVSVSVVWSVSNSAEIVGDRINALAYYGKDDENTFYEHLASNHYMRIVQEHIFCAPCDTMRDVEQHIFKSIDNNRCCFENISELIAILKYAFLKSLNENWLETESLEHSINGLKEDMRILQTSLFSLNDTNIRNESESTIPTERILWATIQKSNKLINTVLNRRHSVLHLSGTAGSSSIYWTEEVKSGDLVYDDVGIHIKSGGRYLIYYNIYFTKRVCDGTETFGYSINQAYNPGDYFPVARVRKSCVKDGSIDTGLSVQSVLEVGLGQQRTLQMKYDKSNHEFIAKSNKLHDIIIFEI